MNLFTTALWVLIVLCALLFLYTRSTIQTSNDPAFKSFQRTYLVVYMMAMAGDWLQGPYVYALYEHYGMTTHEIEILFVAGFGASMVFGTIVGSFADKYGRRNNCILFGILYSMSCCTKHFNNFWVLMLGRLLGGIATSILYSAFESWLIYEHNKRGFEDSLLSSIFSQAVIANSLVAITAGICAQFFADSFGFVAPFDLALTVLIIMSAVLVFTWSENYGDQTAATSTSFRNAFTAIRTDYKVLCLGLIQSLFEGSMYTFVLEWTPALTPHDPQPVPDTARHLLAATEKPDSSEGHRGTIPHGLIFAGFMVAVMIGSSIFKILDKYTKIESFMRVIFFISAISLLMPVLFPGNQLVIFCGFLVFEGCVGIFWPAMGTMRGKYVPESTRATIMNVFRIPLNLIVVVILTQNLRLETIFKCCVMFLLIATACQQWLYKLAMNLPYKSQGGSLPASPEQAPPLEAKKPLLDEEGQSEA